MADIVVQASFNSGEWSPNLYARVDIDKYKSGAALLENFYVDYRGGASTRPGSKYILQAYKSSTAVRVITFKASLAVGYVLEFGDFYLRFYYAGSPILETGFSVTGATKANPCVVTAPGHNYSIGDWVYITNILGMTQLDGRYFKITATTTNTITLANLNGVPIDSTLYSTYTSGGVVQRVYTIATPYAAADLALLKFAQSTNQMILCHPNYPPYILSVVTATNWTLAPIVVGSTATAPSGVVVNTTFGNGSTNYSYVVTSIDQNGQESAPSSPASLLGKQDIRSIAGTNNITWSPVPGAEGYNLYESSVSLFGVVPAGVNYGFIGTCKGTSFIDSNIGPNFSESPPVVQNPFAGSGVGYITVTAPGAYATVPTASTTSGSPTIPASLQVVLSVNGVPPITSGGSGYVVGDVVHFANGLVLTVATLSGSAIASWTVASPGQIYSGGTPGNPMAQVSTSGVGIGATTSPAWGVGQVNVLTSGAGYSSTPTIGFSSGAATATATLTPTSSGNPSVPSFFQQRLVLAAPTGAPQTFYMSQPGAYFNFNITAPVQADNAITETLAANSVNTIKSIVSSTSGMILLTDQAVWLVNGGQSGSAISPTAIVANPQSFVGANDVPPIQANYDILYIQNKGSGVRDLAYNIYFSVFTGSDISMTASHLFFGFTIKEWAWAEAPYYLVQAVRNDGVILTLTFLKEQQFIGWTHQTTQGLYKSVCAVTEATSNAGNVDAVYAVVQRVVNGVTVQYIERSADRVFPSGLGSAWCVDAGVQYTGAAALSFTGAEHLAGLSVTGLAVDNLGNVSIIPAFTMPVSGQFTLPAPTPVGATGYTTVTVGLGYTCNLQTLAIDTSREQIQGKLKKIPHVDVRVNNTQGLSIGPDFNHLQPMKDTLLGNVSSMLTGQQSQVVGGLYSGDARTFLNSAFTIPGQYCIQQSNPYPATVLGVFPALVVEDGP